VFVVLPQTVQRYASTKATAKDGGQNDFEQDHPGTLWGHFDPDGDRRLGLLLCWLGPSGKAHEREDEHDTSHRGSSFVGSRK
jgi:hypothetical protein